MFHVKHYKEDSMKYDIIFADLDGTLLRDDKTIPNNNIEAINKLIDNNIDFVLCSGRSHMSLKNINKKLETNDIEGCDIAFNGGTIFERKPFNIILEEKIDKDTAFNLLKFCRNYDAERMLYAENLLWVENMSPVVINYSKNSILLPKKVLNLARSCNMPVNKIILIGDNNILKQAKEDFEKTYFTDFVDCFFSSDNLLEFNPKNINKGSAVKYIMNLDKFKGKRSLAIGDSYNDIPMFEACDFSLACKNSDQEVKNMASAVTDNDNNQGILLEAIEKYVL